MSFASRYYKTIYQNFEQKNSTKTQRKYITSYDFENFWKLWIWWTLLSSLMFSK